MSLKGRKGKNKICEIKYILIKLMLYKKKHMQNKSQKKVKISNNFRPEKRKDLIACRVNNY